MRCVLVIAGLVVGCGSQLRPLPLESMVALTEQQRMRRVLVEETELGGDNLVSDPKRRVRVARSWKELLEGVLPRVGYVVVQEKPDLRVRMKVAYNAQLPSLVAEIEYLNQEGRRIAHAMRDNSHRRTHNYRTTNEGYKEWMVKCLVNEANRSRELLGAGMEGWVVAVMDAGVTGRDSFKEEILSAFTDQLRVFLSERKVRVVDRGSQRAMLERMVKEEKAASYAACVDEACQIPLGKALAASHILRTTIVRLADTCSANAELIDLKTEITVRAISVRGACTEDKLLEVAERVSNGLLFN